MLFMCCDALKLSNDRSGQEFGTVHMTMVPFNGVSLKNKILEFSLSPQFLIYRIFNDQGLYQNTTTIKE